jgi:hypothetical protein
LYRLKPWRALNEVVNTVQEVITGLVGEVWEAESVWLEEKEEVSECEEGKLVC